MKHLGHIHITGKELRFVYHELEKPNQYSIEKYVELYNASKREVEMSNVHKQIKQIYEIEDYWIFTGDIYSIVGKRVKHNQPCEAEVENGIAMILKIL